MSKKRRDKEHDSSTVGKVAKVGAAALAVGVGAAAFNNIGLTRKLTSEILPALGSTTKQVSKDLRGYKSKRQGLDRRLQAKDIKNIYNKHLKANKTFKDELASRASSKTLRIDTDNKKNNILGQIKDIKQVINNDLGHKLRTGLESKLQQNFIEELALKYKDKASFEDIKALASSAYKDINSNFIKGKDGKNSYSDFLDERFKAAGLLDNKQEFLDLIVKNKNEIEEHIARASTTQPARDNISKKIIGILSENKKRGQGIFGKIDKVLNIDSELAFKGYRTATVNEIIDAYNKDENLFAKQDILKKIKNNFNNTNKYEEINLMEELIKLKDEHNLGDALFDKSIKIDRNGNLFNTTEFDMAVQKQLDKFSSTLPGKLFAGVDIRQQSEAPIISVFRAGSTGKEAKYESGNNSTMLRESKISIGNANTGQSRLYGLFLDAEGNLQLNEEILAEGHIRDNRHGKSARVMKEMLGTNINPLERDTSFIAEALDIMQDGQPTYETRLKAWLNRKNNDDWKKNILKSNKKLYTSDVSMPEKIDALTIEYLNKNGGDALEAKAAVVSKILDDQKEISAMLNDLTASKQINNQTIINLIKSGHIKDESSLRILNLLNDKEYLNTSELIEALSIDHEGQTAKFFNKDLENIINRGYVNSDHLSNMLNISQTKTQTVLGKNLEYTNVLNVEDVIRREAVKEVMLREASEYSQGIYDTYMPTKKGMTKIEQILQNSNLDAVEQKNLSYVTDWGLLQSITKLANDTDDALNLDKMIGQNGALTYFDNLMTINDHFKFRYSSMLDDLASRYSVYDSEIIGNINEIYFNEYNDYTFMKNSIIKDFNFKSLEGINESIKQLGKELTAGRHDMENYTTLTQIPQFFAARLMWGIDSVGLGFSSASTGSTQDLIKNIMTKRVLPIAGAFALYDYLDYESENFTGTSMTGAMANSIANIDMAARRLAYATGAGQAIDWLKESSVWGEYWTGSTDFQTAEERADWYENGYSTVRGGRFWEFGSTTEFRGSAIQYYQPNYLKRAHSNWKEIGIYGSAEEKFKHSWLPSLRHPLSPIRALMDPYWLEKKNMDERPYPLTGKLFSEGTPWGAILNPTIGEMIKPVRMLPEIKKRLGNDGRDIRTVVQGINERIKRRANKNDDMLILRGTDIRTATYTPYANTGDGYMNIQFNNGQALTPGIGFMDNVGKLNSTSVIATGQVQGQIDLPTIDPNGELIQEMASVSYDAQQAVNGIVSTINNNIKKLAARFGGYEEVNPAYTMGTMPDKTQGTYVYTNLVNKRNQFNSDYYASISNPGMIDKNLANDYLKDATYSMGQLSGIYGFLNDFAFGETSYSFRYENAGQMTSFSRHFWDAQVGGIGGGFMEIARRFFASEDKSRINYNPLRNTMPEWLPERFLTGDAYASLPKGEMRMPGKGYESIHDLHPDQFGEYGAFDRMKILGDIAPTSEEYKLWRNIARNTITDPNLIKQMDEVEERATKMSGKHEFYDYRYYNNNTIQKEGIVKSFDGNIVTLVSGEQLRLGGITLNEEADLSMFLQSGQKIHYRTSKDAIKTLEDGIATNAVIYKKEGGFGTNINKELVSAGMAERDKTDRTAIGYLANSSAMQQTLGAAQELIGHTNIPFLHNKYMKIETARESFVNEHIYGTSFATWDNPIKGFVNPALNQTFGQSFGRHLAAVGSSALYFSLKHVDGLNPVMRYGAGALMAGLNPTALLGMGVEFGAQLGLKAIGGGSNMLNIERGAAIGSVVGTVGWGLANAENPFKAAASFAVAGESLSRYLKMSDTFENWGHGKGALVGAGIGLAISAIKNPKFSKDMFRSKWIPEETEKKWELDEYFDRLEYIKYKGLYEQAAARAFLFEGNINLDKIFKKIDKNKEKIAKLTRKAEKLSNKHTAGGYKYEQEMNEINSKIEALQNQQTAFRGGKYTKAAVSYRKAMESTIYGLSESATPDEILASVPVQYRDHYMAFMNERSEKERKKILKQLPEYLRKPLQVAWGEKPDKLDSNLKFFKTHAMPGMAWRGWKPNVNLKHVKMKTIQNEGMLLSDFGYYESEKSKMEYHMAPGIENFDKGQGAISYISNMTGTLSGLGMSVQNISVEPTSAPGLWIAADIKQTANDVGKIGSYAVNSGIQSLTSLLF